LDLDFVGLPRLLDELDCFFDFPDDLPEVLPFESAVPEVAVVEVVDSPPVVVVVEDLRVVAVVGGAVVDGLDDESDPDDGAVVAVDDDDEDGVAASVIWMRSSPSLESLFPSLATKLMVSTSTPDGAS
jgi:hypothetical protein